MELNAAFGFYSTLDFIQQRNQGQTKAQILEWSFYEFYTEVVYIGHANAYQRRLSEIMKRPNEHLNN